MPLHSAATTPNHPSTPTANSSSVTVAAGEARREYHLPRGDAATTLRQFAVISGKPVLFMMEKVQGEQTNAIDGVYTPDEALKALLAGTTLEIKSSEGFVVSRSQSPDDPAGVGVDQNTQPQTQMKKHTKVVAWVLALFGWSAATNLSAQNVAESNSNTTVQQSNEDTERNSEVKKSEDEEKILELPAYQVTSTAQKDTIQRVFEIPNPVTVVGAKTLVESNQLRLQDYAARIPGLTVVPNGLGTQSVVIRGLYSSGSPTVAYVIDEVPFAWSGNIGGGDVVPDLDPGDMATIEILRGPQGTLYGASSLGGLIKYVTVDPLTTGYSGRLSVGTTTVVNGDKLGYNMRGSVNMPASNTVGFGLSGFSRRDPGFIDRVVGDKGINEVRANGGRFSAIWRPASDWSLKFNAFFQEKETDGAAVAQPELGEFMQATLPGGGAQRNKLQAYSATLTGKVDAVALTSITGYNKQEGRFVGDVSGLNFLLGPPGNFPVGVFQLSEYKGIKRLSQELRLAFPITSRTDAVAGGYYVDAKSPTGGGFTPVDASGEFVDNGYILTEEVSNTFREGSVFANLTFKLTDRLDVQVGGRQSSITQSFQADLVQNTVLPIPTGPGPHNRAEGDAFTYLLSPRFKVAPNLMIYGRLASGYRAGGTNNSSLCALDYYPCGFAPDKSKNYELGVKGDFLNHTLSVDASVYVIDWEDIQLNLTANVAGNGYGYTGNAGKARSQGAEVSMEFRPRQGLAVAGWVAWNNAELTETSSLGQKGDRLQFGTDWTGRLSVNQSFSLSKRLRGFIEVSGNYVGEREAGVGFSRIAPTFNYPDYIKYDFVAGVNGAGWSASLFVTNISDKRGGAFGNPSIVPTQVVYIQPRTIGVNVTRDF